MLILFEILKKKIEKPEGKRHAGDLGVGCRINIRIDLREIGSVGVY
jgi:hypothetical protein